MIVPEWLARRGGQLHASGSSCAVILNKEPQYVVEAVPAGGKFACRVKQSINGKRLESAALYATSEEAISGGMEELRKSLGW